MKILFVFNFWTIMIISRSRRYIGLIALISYVMFTILMSIDNPFIDYRVIMFAQFFMTLLILIISYKDLFNHDDWSGFDFILAAIVILGNLPLQTAITQLSIYQLRILLSL